MKGWIEGGTRGRWLVRVSIGALATEHAHVEELWAAMQRAVAC